MVQQLCTHPYFFSSLKSLLSSSEHALWNCLSLLCFSYCRETWWFSIPSAVCLNPGVPGCADTMCKNSKGCKQKEKRSIKIQLGLKLQLLQIPHMLLQERDSKGWAGVARVWKGIWAVSVDSLVWLQIQRNAALRQAESAQLHWQLALFILYRYPTGWTWTCPRCICYGEAIYILTLVPYKVGKPYFVEQLSWELLCIQAWGLRGLIFVQEDERLKGHLCVDEGWEKKSQTDECV